MDVETLLRVFARIAQLQQIENREDVGIKSVITLARKRQVAPVGINRLASVGIEIGRIGHTWFGRTVTVVAHIVERRGDAFIIRRDEDIRADDRGSVAAMISLGDGISLAQILTRVADLV